MVLFQWRVSAVFRVSVLMDYLATPSAILPVLLVLCTPTGIKPLFLPLKSFMKYVFVVILHFAKYVILYGCPEGHGNKPQRQQNTPLLRLDYLSHLPLSVACVL